LISLIRNLLVMMSDYIFTILHLHEVDEVAQTISVAFTHDKWMQKNL
jgi:hypothetical protein